MLSGSIVALITPMDERGNIDRISLKKLIDYHVFSGTSAIVSVGTTGEMSGLSHTEHADMVMWTLDISDGRVPVIAGTGANSTSEAVLLTRQFNGTDIAACLSVAPYYNRPTQEGLFQHFKAISESTDLPQILYNVPVRTGCDILPVTVSRLSAIKNIVGIKEATGDLSRVNQLKEVVDDDFLLFSGDDITALDFMQLGGHGVISVTANIVPQEMVNLCKFALTGNFLSARSINARLMPLHRALFLESNPIPVKWAAWAVGLIKCATLRLPLTSLSADYTDVLKQILINLRLLSL
ncbi:4-hydroxy-tetrahydrodipicolinate synthase [Blochmannia endosymbiont of Polyrhachis (Hedomyrma) turneri]|uniref:4-hydroxy-tetrahydrodipicolinate synthase n=1 Tax=Blochmannia endosymbiont of Polyrhachis (Hedomyrma) turneri TaxID=1505596 RepID=UPI00061A714E|nr:4-hydroxy-tetrahydrodipicolinate synthase [Blochmannia endosymbiont of Polyrhachis (Hedomyrma) turneri]AKC60078.1 dihydrodipicolinate synthase [Blochmannia endosymbiont of Polyrhachis (Hedomyrma) turneri]